MTHIEHSVIIKAPLAQVFTYAADHHTWSEWFEGVSDFKPTTTVTQGNGARYAYKARMMGLTVKVETEVHDFNVNVGWKGVATKGMPHRTYWDFAAVGNETKFTYALEYQIPVPLFGSLIDALLVRRQWEKVLANSLNNLREYFEKPTGGSLV